MTPFWFGPVLASLCACGGPVSRVDLASAGAPAEVQVAPQVLMVTLAGKLGTSEAARCHRTLRKADASGCSWVVFRLDNAGSQGEDAADLQSLLDHVQRAQVKTVAVLQGHVTQGAAALALCTDKTFCLPRTNWGEIEKPDQEWAELLGDNPDEAMAERLTAAREAMAARLAVRDPKLRPSAEKVALAMVDPRTQLIVATVRQGGVEREQVLDQAEITTLTAGGAKILGDRPLPRPLMLTAAEAEEFGLSNGTLQSLDQLADVLLIDRATIGELETNWAEHMVAWLELLQPFLLVAGFLMLLIEVKTPGVGLPGLLGVVFLGLAMFYSYMVGLAEVTEILVFFLGLAAIAVEIFLLPGSIVFGVTGFLCLILALVLSRQSFVLPSNTIEQGLLLSNLANLLLLFIAVLVLGGIIWRLLPRIPWFNRMFLIPPWQPQPATSGTGSGPGSGTGSGFGLADAGLMALVGRTGKTATVLRPTGAMEIDGQRIDVVTEGEFVEAGVPVRVLYVQGPRVVVAAEAASARAGERAGERGSVGLVVLLCIVGLGLLAAEVIFVSFGVIATMAGIALLTAIFFAFQESFAFGVTMMIVEAIASPIVLTMSFRLLPKTPFGKALILDGPATLTSAANGDPPLQALVRRTGLTLTPLRPTGFARIDGQRVEVVTRGEMLDQNTTIVVVEVAGNRVVVARQ